MQITGWVKALLLIHLIRLVGIQIFLLLFYIAASFLVSLAMVFMLNRNFIFIPYTIIL